MNDIYELNYDYAKTLTFAFLGIAMSSSIGYFSLKNQFLFIISLFFSFLFFIMTFIFIYHHTVLEIKLKNK